MPKTRMQWLVMAISAIASAFIVYVAAQVKFSATGWDAIARMYEDRAFVAAFVFCFNTGLISGFIAALFQLLGIWPAAKDPPYLGSPESAKETSASPLTKIFTYPALIFLLVLLLLSEIHYDRQWQRPRSGDPESSNYLLISSW